MNEATNDGDPHHSIEPPSLQQWDNGSSSSSSTSSSSSSITEISRTSSESSNGEETIVEERIISPSEHLHPEQVAMDTDNSSSSGGGDATTITSNESVRRYKNSPFGLNNHYLTMPDPVPVQDDRDRTEKSRASRHEWRRKRHHHNHRRDTYTEVKPHTEPYPDLTITAPASPLSSTPGWRAYGSDGERVVAAAPAAGNGRSRDLKEAGGIAPAYDAGLDARKCNSKNAMGLSSSGARLAVSGGADDYFCAPHDLHTPNHHQTATGMGGATRAVVAAKASVSSSSFQDYDCLLVRFSSIMYATFLVILGCILHCSELRQKSKNSSDHIYTIVVALMGIGWLLFLQGDLQRYKRYASKYILIESIFNDHKQKMRELNSHVAGAGSESSAAVLIKAPMTSSSAQSTSSSSVSLVNGGHADHLSMNTEVIFKKTAYKMYQQRAAALQARNGFQSPDIVSAKTTVKQESAPFDVDNSEGGVENLVPAYKFLHGKMGANFYLKCGMAAFCFGHIIHEGLRFGQQLYFFGTGNVHCRDSAALIAHLITPLYSFYQLFMMFKYSNLVINRHRVLAKFGLMHIVGTSVTFWIRTILEEAYEDFVHKMDYFKSNKIPSVGSQMSNSSMHQSADPSLVAAINSLMTNVAILRTEASERSEQSMTPLEGNNVTSMAQSIWALMSSPISATITPQIARHLPESYACAQNTLLTTKSMNALPYLYPFTIEYNLLLAATFLSLYFNIGKIGSHGTGSCQPFTLYSDSLKKRTRRQQIGSSSSGGTSLTTSSRVSHHESSDNDMSTSKVTTLSSRRVKDMGEYKSNFVVNADCHSANKGLFCGFFVLLVTLVTIVIFFVTINKPAHVQLGIKINLIQEGVLTTLILVVTIIGFKQVSKLNRSPYLKDKVTTDDVLMLIPLPFFFFHSLLSFRAETASLYQNDMGRPNMILEKQFSHETLRLHGSRVSNSSNQMMNISNIRSNSQISNLLLSHRNMSNGQFIENFINDTSGKSDNNGGIGDDHNNNRKGRGSSNINAGNDSSQMDHFKLINVALNIVVMIEVLVQTNFIIDGMRRCSESRYLRFKKPGRELITFAILLNITYWIVATFETKSVEQYKPEIEYYGPLPYMFISHTTLPVMLFYRYHSSVCLAEIWNRAYKPPKRR